MSRAAPAYRWTILSVGVGAQAAQSAAHQGLPALGPALRDAYGLSLTQVGLALNSVMAGMTLAVLLWGVLADRVGERAVIGAGLSGSALALVGAAYAPEFGWLLAALVLAGALGTAATSASGRAVMGWFARDERGLALGIRQTAVPLGGAAGALLLPLCVVLGGVDAGLCALAAVALLGAAAALRWLRDPPDGASQPAAPGDQRGRGTAGGRRAGRAAAAGSSSPLRDPRLWRLSIASALLVASQAAIVSFVVLFLHDHRGVDAALAATALAAIQLGGALVRLIAGWRSDRSGLRLPALQRLALAGAATGALVVGLVDAPLALLVPVLVVAGVLAMSLNGLMLTAAAELAGPARAGTAIGLLGTAMWGTSVLAAIGFAALVAAGSWQLGFAALVVARLLGSWLLHPLLAEERRLLASAGTAVRGPAPAPRPSEGVA